MGLRRIGLLGLSLMATAGVASLQAQTEENLTKPEATFPEGFALVQTVRELPGGRVMVADPLGQILIIADLKAGTADTLGGVGQGPAEYRQPDAVFALPGDATLLVDLGNARLTTVGPDGSFGETMSITQGEPGPGGGLVMIIPRGVDSEGQLYFRPFGGMRRGLPDSAAIARYDRASGTMDTIAMVKLPDMKQSTSGGAGNQNVMIRPVPLSAEDAWAVGWDGRVAIARTSDYHVEWVHPDGSTVSGSPVDYEPVDIKTADKEEWAEGLANGLSVSMAIENGQRRVQFGRGGGGSNTDLDSFEWPEAKPAFASNGVFVTPEGDAWVQRNVPAGEPIRFDVFGSDAELKGFVTIPAGSDIVGFGAGTVYVVNTDDLGLQWLQRYKRTTT
jgi:hypothetical protein